MSKTKKNEKYKRARARLASKQKWKCYYCGCKMFYQYLDGGGTLKPNALTLDHLTPRKKKNLYCDMQNAVAACFACNNKRGDRPWATFLFNTRAILTGGMNGGNT